jgi:lysophospholipase L1-like esterase
MDRNAIVTAQAAPRAATTDERVSQDAVSLPLLDYLSFLSLRRFGKLLFGIVVSLIVGELGVGWFNPLRPAFPPDMTVRDPKLGFRMVPNYRGVMATNAQPFTTNSWGLRDREYGQRVAGRRRIYLIGDSIIFGCGVPVGQTFPRFLEGSLRRRLGLEVEAVNGGIPGYGTLQELEFFDQTFDIVKPDIVLVGVTVLNDLSDNGRFSAQHNGRRHPAGLLERAARWARQRSQLYLLVRRYKAALNSNEMMGEYAVTPSPKVEREFSLTEEALGRFAQAAQRRGVGFGVIIIPAAAQVSSAVWSTTLEEYHLPPTAYAYDRPDVRLTDYARHNGIPVLDLLPVLRAHQDESLYMNDHFTVRGHTLVAGAIADFLQENGLLGTAVVTSGEQR